MDNVTLYTEEEAAQQLCCGVRRLAELAKAGKVPYIKVGKGRRYTSAQVAEILAIHTHRPQDIPRQIPARRRRTA